MEVNKDRLKTFQNNLIEVRRYIRKHFSQDSVLDLFFDGTQTTAPGFAFFYFSNYLYESNNEYIHDIIKKYFSSFFEKAKSDHKDKELSRGHSRFGDYPNNYNSSIQLAGILKTIPLYFEENKIENEFNNLKQNSIFKKHVENMRNEIKDNKGFIQRILEEEKTPSPYLTYWALECIILFDEKEVIANDIIIPDIWNWALNSLYKSISYSHSNIRYGIDTIEACYLIIILNRISKLKHQKINNISEAKSIINHTLNLLFTEHFQLGCFTKSLPVFGTDKGVSLVCPTVEPLSLLILYSDNFLEEYLEYLLETFNYIKTAESPYFFEGKRIQKNIWRSEWVHFSSKPNLFMVSSVATFLYALEESLESILSKIARSIAFETSLILKLRPKTTNSVYFNNKCNSKIAKFSTSILSGGHIPHIICSKSKRMREAFIEEVALSSQKDAIMFDFEMIVSEGWENFNFNIQNAFENIAHIKDMILFIDNIDIIENSSKGNDTYASSQISSIYYNIRRLCEKSKSHIFLGVSTYNESPEKKWKSLYRNGIVGEIHEIQTLDKCSNFKEKLSDICNQIYIEDELLKKKVITLINEESFSNKLGKLYYPDVEKLVNSISSNIHSLQTRNDEELKSFINNIEKEISYNN